MRYLKSLRYGALMLGLLAAGGAGDALAQCQIDSEPIAFGTIDVTRGSSVTGKIVIACDEPASFVLGILGSGTASERIMTGPQGERLRYQLYPDATMTIPWGNGSGDGTAVTGTVDGAEATELPVYGRVPEQRPLLPGSYSDQLTLSLTF